MDQVPVLPYELNENLGQFIGMSPWYPYSAYPPQKYSAYFEKALSIKMLCDDGELVLEDLARIDGNMEYRF